MNQNLKMPSLDQLKKSALQFTAPVVKRRFFIFVMVILLGISATMYFFYNLFDLQHDGYEQQKQSELTNIRLKKDATVESRLRTLETANSGPVNPDYEDGRSNPFSE